MVDRSATVKHKSGGELNIKPLRARTCGLVGEPISVRKYSRETAARKWQPQSPLRTPAETSAEHPKDEVPAILRITGEIRPRSGSQNTELALQAARDDPRPPAGRASHPRDGGGLVWPSHEHPLVAQRHHRPYFFFFYKTANGNPYTCTCTFSLVQLYRYRYSCTAVVYSCTVDSRNYWHNFHWQFSRNLMRCLMKSDEIDLYLYSCTAVPTY